MSIPNATLTRDGKTRKVFATNPIKKHIADGWELVSLHDPLNRTGLATSGPDLHAEDTERAPEEATPPATKRKRK